MTPGHSPQDISRPGKRTARACDECRRLKIRCELPDTDLVLMSEDLRRCRGCSASAIAPVHKRGPPKGYLSALEQRLNDAEALLGALICSKDPRAASLISDLSMDPLASSIINRVSKSEFGPAGRAERARSSASRQFKQSETPIFSIDHNGHLVFTTPSNTWQDYLDMRLTLENKFRSNRSSLVQPGLPVSPSSPSSSTTLHQEKDCEYHHYGMKPNHNRHLFVPSALIDSPGMSEASLKDLHSRLCEEINSWLTSEDFNHAYHGVNVVDQSGANPEFIPSPSSAHTDYATHGRAFMDLSGSGGKEQQQHDVPYGALCDILGLDRRQWEA
ncbi:hypothetical protein Clacol_007729 [Clathrus columnatus]|uniref:Zn(2)-C6 fungal-type domain-containing protein n=1 Tax=Clathrus columnatus TaxID=1419009 RepID=A0AAV5AKS8_9AGAM|nr:hypothetical protein Clacol_007729 [Clathrus columnatus]